MWSGDALAVLALEATRARLAERSGGARMAARTKHWRSTLAEAEQSAAGPQEARSGAIDVGSARPAELEDLHHPAIAGARSAPHRRSPIHPGRFWRDSCRAMRD
jgi:hypothetical protein